MASSGDLKEQAGHLRPTAVGIYTVELCVVGIAYFVLAKVGLALAFVNPSATPIWPPTGLALAAVLLRGYRVWPAILIAAFAANATTAGTYSTSLVIGTGNTLEALLGAWLINHWAGGVDAFQSPGGATRF